MIIKKPYAFLIKKFRWIHGILFAMLVYLGIRSMEIYTFFSDYATNHTYTLSSTLASEYIDIMLFAVTILTILFSALIYFILSMKNKDRKTYMWLCLYYLLIFAYFIYMFTIFHGLEQTGLKFDSIRAIRDISAIVLLPQIVFLFIILGRTLGFNIKQFDFKKDLEELQIDTSDYEEVEVVFGKNNYKTARFIRKFIRLTKYFILENKFFVTICASVIVLITSLVVFINMKVYNVDYNENEEIIANNLSYKITNSYIVTKDLKGNILTEGKSYVIVKLTVSNKTTSNSNLVRDTYRLEDDNDMLIPTFGLENKLSDLGKSYSPMEIKSGSTETLIVAFEVPTESVKKEYIFKIKNFNDGQFGNIESKYKDIIIKPKEIDNKESEIGKYYLPIEVNFDKSILEKSSTTITSFDVDKSFKETYNYCIKDNCSKNTNIIKPGTVGKGEVGVLRIKARTTIDDNVYIKKYVNDIADIITNFGRLEYRVYGKYKKTNITKINNNLSNSEYSYLEVPLELAEANKIEIILTIRGSKYTLVLK